MSNINTNLQTQTSNALHNAIMEAGGKDRPPMLAPSNYVQWKSRIKRYIDIKPNNELIHYCLQNPPYKFKWTEKTVPTTEGYMENYRNVPQEIQDQLNAKAEAKAIERLKQEFLNLITTSCYPKQRKAIVTSSSPTYDQESTMVAEDDEMSKEKEIDKLMALISLSFNKIYKPTNNNLRTSSNTNRVNQDNTPRINKGTGAYHKEKMLLCKQEEARIQLSAEQADWRDNTDDETADQELEAHYMYMAQIQEVTPDDADNSGSFFDSEPLQEVQNNNDHYDVFSNNGEHPEQPEFVNDTYPVEQNEHNVIIDSLDMCYDKEQDDQDDNDDLANERDVLASLIAKLKCEVDDSKARNNLLESSNKLLVNKLTSQIEDFKNKNNCLESSNTHFKEANDELKKTKQMMFRDLKKFQDELEKRHDVNYMSKVALDCAKAKTELMSYKTESQKSINNYSYQINDLNQKISDMKKELVAHQETISIMSQQKEDQIKFYKTHQSVQTMNMLNRNCKTSFVKPEFFKKAQRANPRLYDIGFYNDNLALMLAPDSDDTIRLAKKS
ncbi:hypothetical protein Tco_1352261 [Tanacetum coccineum]